MGACSVEKLECTPEFDMMGFMELSQETRVDGKVMNKMTTLWDEWLKKLSVYKVVCGKISYLLVWLPEEVETYVDETWDKTPSEGYLANSLAQYMCMQSVSADKSASIVIFMNKLKEWDAFRFIRLRGLDASARYRNDYDGCVHSGAYYMQVGLNFSREALGEFDCRFVLLTKV